MKESDVAELIHMKSVIQCIESAFKAQSEGRVLMPSRQVLKTENPDSIVRIMSASITDLNALGLKALLGVPAKRKPGSTYFATLIFDQGDGSLLAMIAANRLTQLRTGAASGIATRLLARENSRSISILGAGVQGYGQLEGVSSVIPLENGLVYDIDRDRAQSLANKAKENLGVDMQVAQDRDQIYKNDILCSATTAATPELFGEKIADGTHVNAVGSNAPNRQEIDVKVLQRSKVFVDKKEQVLEESGDLSIPIQLNQYSPESISGNICDVLTRKIKGRMDSKEITVFKSVGIALEDIAVARRVFELAIEKGIGTNLSL